MEYRLIRLHSLPIQRRRSQLASVLAALAPRTGADTGDVLADEPVEDVEQRARVERRALRQKQRFGCGGGVDDDDRRVAQLDLVHGAVLLGPEAVLLGGEGAQDLGIA